MEEIRDFTQKRYFKVFRSDRSVAVPFIKEPGMSFQMKFARHFAAMCDSEEPIVFPEEKITFTRTNRNLTPAYDFEDLAQEFETQGVEFMPVNNVCPDHTILLNKGLHGLLTDIEALYGDATSEERDFLDACRVTIEGIGRLVDRYAAEAERVNNHFVRDLLRQVPMGPATSFAEALQSIRIISSMFHVAGNYQIGFGRMDQYLIDYYHRDIEQGKLTREEAKLLVKEFFVSLNRDSDLYFGAQQGDNGQSLMLGGVKPDGTCAINELTYMLMEVSKELRLIDPKINLRIDSNTPQDLLELGCELTREGLGFPQYSNDEVVIPALVKAGYSLEDARSYTVAACWEFIIPGKGLEIVNQGSVSFPGAVDRVLHNVDLNRVTEEELNKKIREDIRRQVANVLRGRNQQLLPSPLISLFFDGVLEQKRDVTKAAKYRNRGIHGTGGANGADALYVAKHLIRTGNRSKLAELLEAAGRNFKGADELLEFARNEMPKIGNANAEVDRELQNLFDWFADGCDANATPDCKIRPGTGSAQFYIWLSDTRNAWPLAPVVGATIDGRKANEPFPSSLAPASGVKVSGLMSVLKSFSVLDYTRVMNGGPITVEFSPAALNSPEGITKLVDVIRYFVVLGDQQLQLNILDYRVLSDAMKHPERHSNLIVRVWGWSGYFCELTPEFQRQIINRHRYAL